MAGLMDKAIVIIGPTASGKTSLSLKLSEISDIEIISSDSRQLYKYLDIGTAKPTKEELNAVKHHFIDYLTPDEYYSAGRFGKEAKVILKKIHENNKIPVITGGSGLYIQALCDGLFDEEAENEKREGIRKTLYSELEKCGKEELYNKLIALDPEIANYYADKNPRRTIRALEHILTTGELFSTAIKKNFEKKLKCVYFGINFEREELYKRINKRVDIMIEQGLIKETENVLNMGYSKDINSLNTVGYKEIINFLEGTYSLDFAIEEIKKNTRRYAKRQITWFKRYSDAIWFEPDKIDTKTILNAYNEI